MHPGPLPATRPSEKSTWRGGSNPVTVWHEGRYDATLSPPLLAVFDQPSVTLERGADVEPLNSIFIRDSRINPDDPP